MRISTSSSSHTTSSTGAIASAATGRRRIGCSDGGSDALSLVLSSPGLFDAAMCRAARFVDIQFQRLMKGPIETLRAAYARMERELGDEHAERIVKCPADEPKGKFGKHRYSSGDWGCGAGELRELLRPCIDHFDVELE